MCNRCCIPCIRVASITTTATTATLTLATSIPVGRFDIVVGRNLCISPCALCKAWIPIVKDGVHEPPKHGICPYRKPSKCKTEPSFGCRWGFTA